MSPARPLLLCATAIAVVAAAVPAANASSAFGGAAYGSKAHLGSYAKSGKSAFVTLCTSRSGVVHRDSTAKARVPHLGTIGAVHTKIWSTRSHGTAAAHSAATTASTALLMRNLTAATISAKATVSRKDGKYRMSGSTTLVGLKVFGKSVPVHPKRNQRLALPGIGSLIFNHQQRSTRLGVTRISVTAVTLQLAGNNTLGLPAGSVLLSRATATMHKPVHRQMHGVAYGTSVNVGSAVVSGKTSPTYLPCGGSDGQTITNRTAGVHVKGLRIGATRTSARSADSGKRSRADFTAQVAGLHLLGNEITASALRAHVSVARGHSGLTRGSHGTEVLGLRINGKKFDGTRPANTKYAIPGLGTLWIHRVVKTKNGAKVYALELDLNTAQSGFAKGTVIRVAGASAVVRKH